MEGADSNLPSQLGGPESHCSPGQKRWEAEEEAATAKEEPPKPEDEGSTSGVGR